MKGYNQVRGFLVNPRVLVWLLIFIFIMNALDAFFTLGWVNFHLAKELNPVMAYLLERGSVLFLLVKITIVSLAVTILYYRRNSRLAQFLIWPTSFLYLAINMWHMYNLVKIFLL